MAYDEIPVAVFQGLEEARQDGRSNMLDRRGVEAILEDLGQDSDDALDAYDFIHSHPKQYGEIVMRHFSTWKQAQA